MYQRVQKRSMRTSSGSRFVVPLLNCRLTPIAGVGRQGSLDHTPGPVLRIGLLF